MNMLQPIIITVALVLTLWITCSMAGAKLKTTPLPKKIEFIVLFILIQIIMAGAGIWIGNRLGSIETNINLIIGSSILFIFGFKVLLSSLKNNPLDRNYNYNDISVITLSALGESITVMSVSITIGLISDKPLIDWLIMSSVLCIGLIIAFILGLNMVEQAKKFRFGPIGGFLMIFAAILFILTLIGS